MFNSNQTDNSYHLPRSASIKVKKGEYKDVIKKRTMENLKRRRKELRDMIRDPTLQFQHDEQYQEYINICKKELEDMLSREKGDMTDDEYFELLLEMEREIENEIRKEEEELIAEYELNQQMEALDMEELIDFYEKSVFLCPLCRKNPLLETKHSLFCKCGLRVPTSVRFDF